MRAVILMYHIIDQPLSPGESRFACPPKRFDAHMQALRDAGLRIMALPELAAAVAEGDPEGDGAVALTLDDGFSNNLEYALPILKRHKIPATVFVVAGRINGNNDWMTQRGYPLRSMLEESGIRELSQAGIFIGAHTVTHPRLPDLNQEVARREIFRSRTMLEERLDSTVDQFAYPYGAYSERDIRLVKEAGFTLACTTRSGYNRAGEDPFLLRRIEIHGVDSPRQVLRKIRFGSNEAGLGFMARYYTGRVRARLPKGSRC